MPNDVTSLLQSLIRIPSVNPDYAPGTDQTGEAAMADYVQRYLEKIGFAVTQEEILPGRPNVMARAPFEGTGPDLRPRILFGPHLDTVTIIGMTIDPFGGDISDGKIHGRGASDTKGPMAAMLQALSHCRELLATLPVAVDFVGFMGEEASQHGSKHFAKHHAHEYAFALVGEPTSLNIVHVTKGSLWATLTTTGKAAHASQPETGENAILKLTRALDLMDQHLVAKLASYQHPVLDRTTLNIATIKGGTLANIVPDHATAQIDIRTTPSIYQAGGALSVLEKFISDHHLPVCIEKSHENPPMETAADNPWIQQMQSANPTSKPVGAPWFSDAAHLTAAGVPSVCIGPGGIEQAHTKDEFIQIDDLESGVDHFERFIRSLA
ncbi:MAG: M20 family metallopeptidase [Verrucomicrobiae bacterium]|nr:M20 family metallopeptidase [Verrucomicrobiae bacterium]NNJ43347.1 M20 family metallopeptidase [Akkermansiaceae bacterium]